MSYGCYVHIPFCEGQKCPYCGFFSVPYSAYMADDYIPALLEQARRSSSPESDTLYIGGGTPSCLTATQLETLLVGLQKILPLSSNAEITVELNPENVSEDLATLLFHCGATRVSLGAQSLVQRQLSVLGRKHTAERTITALNILKRNSFLTSIDLIFGVPGQQLEEWDATINRAIELDPDHISIYCLSFEEGTPFAYALRKGLIAPVGSEKEHKMFYSAREKLMTAGYEHYEISNFSKPGKSSKHNTKYWTGEGYIGIGAGAHSYIQGPPRWIRMSVVSNVHSFLRRIDSAEQLWDFVESLDLPKRVAEFLMLRLRLLEGFSVEDVARCLPELDAIHFVDLLRPLESAQRLIHDSGRIRIPPELLFVSDSVILACVHVTESYVRQVALKHRNISDDIDMAEYISNFRGADEPGPQK
ncbi:MAG TPA: radical SAM family heme chaperone HemW [candidate division Zixibacteria bacterium]|nr:radical SAM family heme chaperone HemW [candidate division Zixibacteria bacterium]